MQELRVMKVKQSEGSKCYIAVLNSSDSALPQAVLNASATVSNSGSLCLCRQIASIVKFNQVV